MSDIIIQAIGFLGLLAFIASTVSTIFYWTNDARKLRLANLFVSSPCWIIYDSIVGSMGGVISESFTMISIVVSIYRFGLRKVYNEVDEVISHK